MDQTIGLTVYILAWGRWTVYKQDNVNGISGPPEDMSTPKLVNVTLLEKNGLCSCN